MDNDIAFECFTKAGVYLNHRHMSDVGDLLLKASGRIEFLEQQLSDLSKTNSEIKAQGIREAVKECRTTISGMWAACTVGSLRDYADNLIKENKGESHQ